MAEIEQITKLRQQKMGGLYGSNVTTVSTSILLVSNHNVAFAALAKRCRNLGCKQEEHMSETEFYNTMKNIIVVQ
jgi:hypothetical protein